MVPHGGQRGHPRQAAECTVDVRGKELPARIVKPLFVRHGEACEGIL
jgi:hypothetical protein